MSQTTVKEFFARAVADKPLLARLKAAEDLEGIVGIAAAEGVHFSLQDLDAANPPRLADRLPESKLGPSLDSLYCSMRHCDYTSYASKCVDTVPQVLEP